MQAIVPVSGEARSLLDTRTASVGVRTQVADTLPRSDVQTPPTHVVSTAGVPSPPTGFSSPSIDDTASADTASASGSADTDTASASADTDTDTDTDTSHTDDMGDIGDTASASLRTRPRTLRGRLGWRNLKPASPAVVAQFGTLLTVLRWSTLSLALAFALIDHDGRRAALAGGVLVAYAMWRTIRPIGSSHGEFVMSAALLLEVALGVAVVEATGFGRSPFLVCLGVAAVLAGFTGGIPVVIGVASLAGLAVALPSLVIVPDRSLAGTSIQFAIELVVVGVVGGFSRYLVEEARQAGAGLGARVEHLAEVNELLFDLHRATEYEATPLHLEGAARWAVERLDEAFAADVAATVVFHPATEVWQVAAAAGIRSTEAGRSLELPPALARAVAGSHPVELERFDRGLSYRSRWGLYCPMRVRDELVGVLAVEADSPRSTTHEDRRRMADLARAAGLALDNARWLERIHILGVEQERTRLARELHDHIGQSIVYLGFELDRLVQMEGGRAMQKDLLSLRGDVRNLVEELRDMLVDLRSDVSEKRDVESVLESFLERVNRRQRVAVKLTAHVDARLPLPVEREFWRVACEAVMNAERHSRASEVSVLWACSAEGALLEVSDDGVGMPAGKTASVSGYGLVGMRERADSVGAQLDITSKPNEGTTVRMRMRMKAA